MRQKKTVLAALLLSALPKATVHKENVPIKEILALIEKSTDCSFFWNTSDFDAMKTVTVNVDNAPVTEIISSILPGFECRIDKSKIMLVKKAGANKAARNTPWTITGSVYENSGEPLPGAPSLYVTVTSSMAQSPEWTENSYWKSREEQGRDFSSPHPS